MSYYIGLMSGTSMDAIDAALIEVNQESIKLMDYIEQPFQNDLSNRLKHINEISPIKELARLDIEIGRLFAETVNKILHKNKLDPDSITAIGSHGQTIFHDPNSSFANSLQIGDPNTIAALTGITTVADFRRRDIAYGGQGAPLAPIYHAKQFELDPFKVVINIGGFSNLTLINSDGIITGFDIGPGNVLLDDWNKQHNQTAYDRNGDWAASGSIDKNLLSTFLQDPYFSKPPPKSTGRDYFNLNWLDQFSTKGILPENVQASLLALTVETIALAIEQHAKQTKQLIVCGGGALNSYLLEQLNLRLTDIEVASSKKLGIDPSAVEASCFAWLAHLRLAGKPGNLPTVTAATRETILGGIYPAR